MTTLPARGRHWVLNGQKKWIGNATFADINVIWARRRARTGQGFVVGKDNPASGREDQNQDGPRRAERADHAEGLPRARGGSSAECQTPSGHRRSADDRTGWPCLAVGCQMGAYEHAPRYATERIQFKEQPVNSGDLLRVFLVRMLGNVTSTQAMMLRLAQLQDEGVMLDEHASLAKAFCTVKCRETVGYARELLGGNGILLENHIGRFVADAEAIYSYEGTREMNTLIVGKSITGLSAFV